MFKLPQLTYSRSALEPFLSSETVDYHYGKHHKAYINEVNHLIRGTRFEDLTLEDIVLLADGALFNNASQAWNHTFYWKCMCPHEKSERHSPSEDLLREINNTFGSIEKFKGQFTEKASSLFGSGWLWLVVDSEMHLRIVSLPNADSPMRHGLRPLLGCDVWEHAYYIDYRNNRRRYVDGFLNAIDWAFVSRNLESDQIPDMTRCMLVNGHGNQEKEVSPAHSVA